MNYYLKNSQNGNWYTVSAKIRGAIFIIIRVWFLLLNLHVIKAKINANVYQVRFESIEHRLLAVFPTPSHCVHPLMLLPKVYSSLGEPQLRTPGWTLRRLEPASSPQWLLHFSSLHLYSSQGVTAQSKTFKCTFETP